LSSDRQVRRFVRQWRKRYPFPVPWVDDSANKQFRRSESQWLAPFERSDSLKKRDIVSLVRWRFAGQPDQLDKALEGVTGPAASGHAKRCIKKALSTPAEGAALDCLLDETGGIPGWGPAMASVVLAVCQPQTYVVADRRAVRTLNALGRYSRGHDDELARADWGPYLRACRTLAHSCGLPLRDVGRALEAAADEAPKLPAATRSPRPRGKSR
jgi:hypothetical protein